MKLKNYLMMAVLAIFAAACSNDDEPQAGNPTVPPIAEKYEGVISANVMGKNQGNYKMTLELTIGSDGKASMKVPGGWGSGMMTMPELNIEGIAVTSTGSDSYTISKPETEEIVVGETNYQVSDVKGTVKGSEASITFNATPAAMAAGGMVISCSFNTPVNAVTGKYEGTITMQVSGEDQGSASHFVELVAGENGTVKLHVPAGLGTGMMTMGEIDIEGVAVTLNDDASLSLKKEGTSEYISGETNYQVGNVTGTINGKDDAEISFDATPAAMGNMGMTINFVLNTAEAPAEGE